MVLPASSVTVTSSQLWMISSGPVGKSWPTLLEAITTRSGIFSPGATLSGTIRKDGKHLISFSRWGSEVRVWDLASGKLIERKRVAERPAWLDLPEEKTRRLQKLANYGAPVWDALAEYQAVVEMLKSDEIP